MDLWPLGVYFLAVMFLVTAMITLSYILGERHDDLATGHPYESGILSEGTAEVRLSIQFYRMSMFFIIFDLEALFIFAWAVAGRELGRTGYWAILIFIGVLLAVLLYLWRLGALDWGPKTGMPGKFQTDEKKNAERVDH